MFDDNDGQLKNAINALKGRLPSSSPAELASIKTAADILFAAAANTPFADMLKDFISKVSEAEKTLQVRIIDQTEQQAQAAEKLAQEQQALKEFEEHEKNKATLTVTSKALDELIKDGFHEELKKDNDLLEKAVKDWNSLTKEEQKKISEQGLTEEEKIKLEEEDRKKTEKINIVLQAEESAEKVIEYAQKKLDENHRKYGTDPTKIPEAIKKENRVHENDIANGKKTKEQAKLVHNERDKERKNLLEFAEKNPEIAAARVKKHYKRYKSNYTQLKQADPNHKGLDELNQLVELCGGHEKLGLDKSSTPSQTNMSSQSSSQTQDTTQNQKQSHKIIEIPTKTSILSKYSEKVQEVAGKCRKALVEATAKFKSSQNQAEKIQNKAVPAKETEKQQTKTSPDVKSDDKTANKRKPVEQSKTINIAQRKKEKEEANKRGR